MSAAAAMKRAYAEGVHMACDGDNLVLWASNPPKAEVINLLRKHKTDIIALLDTPPVASDADSHPQLDRVVSGAPNCKRPDPPNLGNMPSSAALRIGDPAHYFGVDPLTQKEHAPFNSPSSLTPTNFLSEGTEGGKGGEGGVSVVCVRDEGNDAPVTEEFDPNPHLPWPQTGETLLEGWGTRVSMEYRLRNASEDECLDWAKEPWQLELVAKARGYSRQWVDQILRNRLMWKEVFAARDECRAVNFEQFR